MTILIDDSQVVPVEHLFWARLDPVKIGVRGTTSRADRRRLGYAFERFLPCSIEQVHAVYVMDRSEVIACGIRWEDLRARLGTGVVRLQPRLVPDWLESAVEPAKLNLARFEATPPAVRDVRKRLAITLSLAVSIVLCMVTLGLQRRAAWFELAAAGMRRSTDASIEDRLGPSSGGQLPRLRLTAELRRLRSLASSSSGYSGAGDAVGTLAAVLAAWPEGAIVQTESLTCTATTMRVRTRHETTDNADAFAKAWRPDPARWTAQQPGLTSQRDEVRLELVCQRKESP